MASSEDMIVFPFTHSTPKHIVAKVYGHEKVNGSERKSLQILQQSATDEKTLVGKGLTHSSTLGKADEKMKIRPTHGPFTVFHDPDEDDKPVGKASPMEMVSMGTQTDDSLLEDLIEERLRRRKRDHSLVEEGEDEAYQLMVKEPVPERYWEEVAEQRRLALSDTLEENKSLHQELDSLREENEKLSELAGQAEYLSSLLQSVVDDDDDNDAEEDKDKLDAADDDGGEEQQNVSELVAANGIALPVVSDKASKSEIAKSGNGKSNEVPVLGDSDVKLQSNADDSESGCCLSNSKKKGGDREHRLSENEAESESLNLSSPRLEKLELTDEGKG